VSGQLDLAAAVFAQLEGFPKRQVARVSELRQGLIGYRGASEFDFYNSRFRRLQPQRSADESDQDRAESIETSAGTEPLLPAACAPVEPELVGSEY